MRMHKKRNKPSLADKTQWFADVHTMLLFFVDQYDIRNAAASRHQEPVQREEPFDRDSISMLGSGPKEALSDWDERELH